MASLPPGLCVVRFSVELKGHYNWKEVRQSNLYPESKEKVEFLAVTECRLEPRSSHSFYCLVSGIRFHIQI